MLVYKWSVASTSAGRSSKLTCIRDFGRIALSKITFHPIDRSILLVSGNGYLKQLYINDEQLVPSDFEYKISSKTISELAFTDHLWNEENQLVACTKSGELLTF